jgi:hypothetical protein
MRIICGPPDLNVTAESSDKLHVVLYGGESTGGRGSAGAAIVEELRRKKLAPCPRAWDFLSIALAVTAADLAGHATKVAMGGLVSSTCRSPFRSRNSGRHKLRHSKRYCVS